MKEITRKALIENIEEITELVNAELESRGFPMKTVVQIDVCIDEIVSNIAYYAYGKSIGDVTVGIDFPEGARTVALTFSDTGREYDPLSAEEPDITLPANERRIGGLGIHIVKKTMDELCYKRESGKNVFKILKRI